jgi:hypothetical protein
VNSRYFYQKTLIFEFFGILDSENSRIVSFIFSNLCVNSKKIYLKTRFQQNWGFGALGAYVLFRGLGIFGAYIIGGLFMFTYLGPLYIGAGPNFDWPPKLTALPIYIIKQRNAFCKNK